MRSDFYDDPRESFEKGKASKKATDKQKEWMGVNAKGEQIRLQKCWSDPDGCEMYFPANDYDFEHRLCKQCCRTIETTWGVRQTMVGIVRSIIRLDRVATSRIIIAKKDEAFMETWRKGYDSRVKWFLEKIGDKPENIGSKKLQELSLAYFRGALTSAGIETGKGSGLV